MAEPRKATSDDLFNALMGTPAPAPSPKKKPAAGEDIDRYMRDQEEPAPEQESTPTEQKTATADDLFALTMGAGGEYVPTAAEMRLAQTEWKDKPEAVQIDYPTLTSQQADVANRLMPDEIDKYIREGMSEREAKQAARESSHEKAREWREEAMTVHGGRYGEVGPIPFGAQSVGKKVAGKVEDIAGEGSLAAQAADVFLAPQVISEPRLGGDPEERARGAEMKKTDLEKALDGADEQEQREARLRALRDDLDAATADLDTKRRAGIMGATQHSMAKKQAEAHYAKEKAKVNNELPPPQTEMWDTLLTRTSDVAARVTPDTPAGEALYEAFVKRQTLPMPRDTVEGMALAVDEMVAPVRDEVERTATLIGQALRRGDITKEQYNESLSDLDKMAREELGKISTELSGSEESLPRELLGILHEEIIDVVAPIRLWQMYADLSEAESVTGEGGTIERATEYITPSNIPGVPTKERLAALGPAAMASYGRVKDYLGYDPLNFDLGDPRSNPAAPAIANAPQGFGGRGSSSALLAVALYSAAKGGIRYDPEEGRRIAAMTDEEREARRDEMMREGSEKAKEIPGHLLSQAGGLAQETMTGFHDPSVIMEGPEKGEMLETPVAGMLRKIGTVGAGLFSTAYGRALSSAGMTDRDLQLGALVGPDSPEWLQRLEEISGDPTTAGRMAAVYDHALRNFLKDIPQGALSDSSRGMLFAEYLLKGGATEVVDEKLLELTADLPKGVAADVVRAGMMGAHATRGANVFSGNYWKDYLNTVATARGFYEENGGIAGVYGMDPESPTAKALSGLGLVIDVGVPFESMVGMPAAGAAGAKMAWDVDAPMRAAGATPKTRAKMAARVLGEDLARRSPVIGAARRGERIRRFSTPEGSTAEAAAVQKGKPTDLRALIDAAHERALADQAATQGIITPTPEVENITKQVIEGLGVDYDVARGAWLQVFRRDPALGAHKFQPEPVRPNFAGTKEYDAPYRSRRRDRSLWGRLKREEAKKVRVPGSELQKQMGIKSGSMDPGALFGHAQRYAISEANRAKVPGRYVPITRRSIVPEERLQWLNDKVYLNLSDALGETPDAFAKKAQSHRRSHLKPAETQIPLKHGPGGMQATGLRGLVEDAVDHGVGGIIPERIKDPNADWNYITVEEYAALVEAVTDRAAGAGSGRSKKIESMPVAALERAEGALFGEGAWTAEGKAPEGKVRQVAAGTMHGLANIFTAKRPFKRMGPEMGGAMDRMIRSINRVPEDLEALFKAMHEDWQARAVGAGNKERGAIRTAAEVPGQIVRIATGRLVNPNILNEALGPLAPPVRYDATTQPAFAFVNKASSNVEHFNQLTPTSSAVEIGRAYAPMVDPSDAAVFVESAKVLFKSDTMRDVGRMERAAIARSEVNIAAGRPLDSNDSSIIVKGVMDRQNAMIRRGEDILRSFAGLASDEVLNATKAEKVFAYEAFYAGRWEDIENMHALGGTKKTVDRPHAVASLLAKTMADERIQKGMEELVALDAYHNAETMRAASLAREPVSEAIVRRKNRIYDHLDSLGVPAHGREMAWRAYLHSTGKGKATGGLGSALRSRPLDELIHVADAAAADRAKKTGAPESPAEKWLRIVSHDMRKRGISTRAQLNAATTDLLTELSVNNISRDALSGPLPLLNKADEFAESVARASQDIMGGRDGVNIALNPDGTLFEVVNGQITDPIAHLAARNMLDRWGYEMAQKVPTNFVPYEGPGGKVVWLPKEVADEIVSALDAAAPIGKKFSGKGLLDSALSGIVDPKKVANAITTRMKQALTIGKTTVHLPFVAMQIMGNPLFMYQNYGLAGTVHALTGSASLRPVKGARPIISITNPALIWDVTNSMWDIAPGVAKRRTLVTDSGAIYTADQLAAMARREGLDSALVSAAFERQLEADFGKYLSGNAWARDKLAGPVAGAAVGGALGGPVGAAVGFALGAIESAPIQNAIRKVGSAADNAFRATVFCHELKLGKTPTEAASIARRVVLDYSMLSETEKNLFRHLVIFYSYTRRSAASAWWTLLRHPERIASQVRLVQASHKATMGEDWRMLTNDYKAARMAAYMKQGGPTPYGKMGYWPAQFPVFDALTLTAQMTEPWQEKAALFGRLNPVASSILTNAVFEKDDFMGLPADDPRNNIVPAWFVAWDYALAGGRIARLFDVRYSDTADPRRAIDQEGGLRGAFVANNWAMWHGFTDVYGLSRTLGETERVDRTDHGIVEVVPNAAMALRDVMGWDLPYEGHEIQYQLATGKGAAPRPGVGSLAETVGAFGFPGRPATTGTVQDVERSIDRAVEFGIRDRAKKEETPVK